jgi:hypothetical protein
MFLNLLLTRLIEFILLLFLAIEGLMMQTNPKLFIFPFSKSIRTPLFPRYFKLTTAEICYVIKEFKSRLNDVKENSKKEAKKK